MKILVLAIALATVASATPLCQGSGVYCSPFHPEFEGQLLNRNIGLITWLAPEAETDTMLYMGPVFFVSPSEFFAPGIGDFLLWKPPVLLTEESDRDHSQVPEPA